MHLPEIRIQHGYLLEQFFAPMYREWKADPDWEPASREEILAIVERYQRSWAKHETVILENQCHLTSLQFKKELIDVYIVSAMRGGISTPCVIASHFESDLFVDVLTHELFHVLLSDNAQQIPMRAILDTMFPDIEDRKVKNHVVLHALHKNVYLEVLHAPDRLARDQQRCIRWKEYHRAWNIVEERGYNEIIEEFRSHY